MISHLLILTSLVVALAFNACSFSEETATGCPPATEGTQLLTHQDHGYCLRYPTEYAADHPNDHETVIIFGSLLNVQQPRAYIEVQNAGPLTYDSDLRRAREIMLDHAEEYTAHLQADAQAELQAFMKRYPVLEASVAPRLYTVMTDKWIELTLRYVVEARERRKVTGNLYQGLLQHFEQEPNITVASATFEIVGLPPLKGDLWMPYEVEPETTRVSRDRARSKDGSEDRGAFPGSSTSWTPEEAAKE
jgi:hypothetical protein